MAEAHREEIAKLEALYAAHPEGRVFTHLAEAYRRAGELERAREILEDGLRRHPDYSSAHVVSGRVLMDLGETEGATHAFRRVLELDRHNLVALRSLGDLSERAADRAAAVGYYKDLIALDPSDDRLRMTVSRLEDELRQPGAAEAQPHTAETASGEPGIEAAAESVAEPEEVPADESDFEPDIQLADAEASPEQPTDHTEALAEAATDLDLETDGFRPLTLDATGDDADALVADTAGFETFGEVSLEWPDASAENESGEVEAEPDAFAGLGWTIPEERPDEPATGSQSWSLEIGHEAQDSAEPAGASEPDQVEPADDLSWASMEERAQSAWSDSDTTGHGSAGAGDPIDELTPWDADPPGLGEEMPEPLHGEPAEVVTATMAELYARQGFYDRAIDVYRQLIEQVPEDERLRERLEEVEALQVSARDRLAQERAAGAPAEGWVESVESMWTGGSGVAGTETTPYAWADTPHSEEAGQGGSVGDYFRGLLSWRPAGAPEGDLLELEEEDASGEVMLEAGAVEAQMDEWFGDAAAQGGEPTDETRSEAPEADADLEMFRTWLQSLKK